MSCAPKEPSDAPPQKPLSRACAHHFRHPTQADQGGAGLSPCTGRPCGGRGQHVSAVSATFHLANSALRKWVQRFAQEGPQGLLDRSRSGRPPKVTCELEQHLNRLVDQDPLHHGSLYSQWSCRELATVLAQQTGVQLGRESVRCVLKKTRVANLTRCPFRKSCASMFWARQGVKSWAGSPHVALSLLVALSL